MAIDWEWIKAEENRKKVALSVVGLFCVGLAIGLTLMYRPKPAQTTPHVSPMPLPVATSNNSPLKSPGGAMPPSRSPATSPTGAMPLTPSPAHALGQTPSSPPKMGTASAAASGASDKPSPAAPSKPAPAAQQPFYATYRYEGERYRDPFIPLTGNLMVTNANVAPNIATLVLKGIIQDMKGGRIALLSSGTQSYLLRGGRLYDNSNKTVPGIAGVVKNSSVVLIGSTNRQSTEIKIKDAQP